jgi:alanine racemase
MNTHPSVIHINESALKHNLKRVRNFAPRSKVLAMLKANAYGHGLLQVAKALADADAFGVACLAEAIRLREAKVANRIVLMRGVFTTEELVLAQYYQIELVIHQLDQVALLEQSPVSSLPLWLKVNTGMNRLGLSPENLKEAYQRLQKISAHIQIMTHFACADEMGNPLTAKQIKEFASLTSDYPVEKSLANSAGIVAWPESHADWVRPGLMLYGVSPIENKVGRNYGLQPVMTWQSELIALRQQRQGDAVGYGSSWTCPYDGLIGVVGVGYADGYPRHAKSGTPIEINHKQVSLIGRVSMDMLAIDLRTQPQVKIGDVVTLWGDSLPIEHVALHTASNAYELLCNARVRC